MMSEMNANVLEMNFNGSVVVTELLMKTLENAVKAYASECIKEVAIRNNLNAEVEIAALNLSKVNLIRKPMAKKAKSDKPKAVKAPKEKKNSIPLPFTSASFEGCQGLCYNHGLFTQCVKPKAESGEYCKSCQTEADKNANGQPNCGTVAARLATGLYEFKDPKGRSPTSYLKVLEKMKISEADANTEYHSKFGSFMPIEHLTAIEKPKKSGRPKKATQIKADNVQDLFAKATAEDVNANPETLENKPSSKKAKLTEEEKAAKKAALEKERAEKKLERELKLAAEKAEKEANKKAEAEKKKAEREAAKAEEKAKKDAAKAEEKAKKDAAKADKKGKKAEHPADKREPVEVVKVHPLAAPVLATPVSAPAPAEVPKVKVTRITIDGETFLKSSDNVVYNTSKEAVGIWDSVNEILLPLPDEDEEEEQEEESLKRLEEYL